MKNKLKIIFSSHKYAAVLFISTVVYYIAFVGVGGPFLFKMSSDTHIFYFPDYSMGFCSKFLQGAIYNFFFDDLSIEAVSAFNTILFFVFLFLIILLLEFFIKSVEKENRAICTFLFFLFLAGPSSFTMHYYMLGSMDSYWLYFAVLSLLFMTDKRLYFMAVPMSALSILVNYGSLICFIPFIVILMIYKLSVVEDKREKIYLGAVTAFVITVSVGLTVYFVMFENDNLTYSLREFTKIMSDRGFNADPFYYKSTLYEVDYKNNIDYKYINSFDSPVVKAFVYVFHRMLFTLKYLSVRELSEMVFFILPPVIAVLMYFAGRIKEELKKNKLRAFSYFCCFMMFFVTAVAGILVSTDSIRFIAHAYTILLASFFFIAFYERDTAIGFMRDKLSRIPVSLVAVYSVFYAFSFYDPVG